MNILQLILVAAGLMSVMVLVWTAFSGPSAAKESSRRLRAVRFRHSESTKDRVEAQMRKAIAARKPRLRSGVRRARNP